MVVEADDLDANPARDVARHEKPAARGGTLRSSRSAGQVSGQDRQMRSTARRRAWPAAWWPRSATAGAWLTTGSTRMCCWRRAWRQCRAVTDAMNEKGMNAAVLYMPGFCEYTPAEWNSAAWARGRTCTVFPATPVLLPDSFAVTTTRSRSLSISRARPAAITRRSGARDASPTATRTATDRAYHEAVLRAKGWVDAPDDIPLDLVGLTCVSSPLTPDRAR